MKCLEEVNQLLKGPTSLYTICVVSHLFVTKLEKTNLYRDVKLFFSPFKGDIALHFEIEDKIPYFMSASNELDTNGAVFAVKLGVKNFLGY